MSAVIPSHISCQQLASPAATAHARVLKSHIIPSLVGHIRPLLTYTSDLTLPIPQQTDMVYTAEPLEYPEVTTLSQLLLEQNVNDVPADKPTIIDGISGKTVYTYSSFRTAVKKVANYLQTAIGVPQGSVVAILASNSVRQNSLFNSCSTQTLI